MIVKENQGGLLTLLQVSLDTALATYLPLQRARCQETGHGRIERRTLTSTPAVAGKLGWPGLAQGFRLERWTKEKKTGKERQEVVYGITSLPVGQAGAATLLALIRGHWQIEKRSHWVRDVTFDEDRSQARSGSVPQVMAALRPGPIFLGGAGGSCSWRSSWMKNCREEANRNRSSPRLCAWGSAAGHGLPFEPRPLRRRPVLPLLEGSETWMMARAPIQGSWELAGMPARSSWSRSAPGTPTQAAALSANIIRASTTTCSISPESRT
jgi:hypothetical protein